MSRLELVNIDLTDAKRFVREHRAAGFTPDEGLWGSRTGQQWHADDRLFDDGDEDNSGPKIRWRRRLA